MKIDRESSLVRRKFVPKDQSARKKRLVFTRLFQTTSNDLCLRQVLHSQHKHKYATANPPFPILQLLYQHCCDVQLTHISTLSTEITSKHNFKLTLFQLSKARAIVTFSATFFSLFSQLFQILNSTNYPSNLQYDDKFA